MVVKYKDEIPEENGSEFAIRTMSLIRNVFSIPSDEVSLIANDLEVKEQLDSENTTAVIEIKDDKTVEDTIELLQEDPRVEYVEPNYIRNLYSIYDVNVNDPDLLHQGFLLEAISWPDAFNTYS
nr:hypothetical protein [bacterium]